MCKKDCRIVVSIANTDRNMLEYVQQFVHSSYIRHRPSDGIKKESYELEIYGDTAVELLKLTHPYMITKKERAKILLLLHECKQMFGKRLPLEFKSLIFDSMKERNRRGA